MVIAQSFRRKALVTIVAVGAFASLYEATILDSKYISGMAASQEPGGVPTPGDRLPFGATAYCKGSTTASGAPVRTGIAAADPKLLPVGSVIQVSAPAAKYSGIYTVMDTGPAIKGRLIDIYMWSCYEALDFGRTAIELTVLRLGWNPQATAQGVFERLFQRSVSDARTTLSSRPLSQAIVP